MAGQLAPECLLLPLINEYSTFQQRHVLSFKANLRKRTKCPTCPLFGSTKIEIAIEYEFMIVVYELGGGRIRLGDLVATIHTGSSHMLLVGVA